jgi:DNA polymerase-3 subunit gamma/tau
MRNSSKDLAGERPSRVSRVMVILSTLGVAVIATWVFAPMLLANYASTVPTGTKSHSLAQQPVIVPPPAPVAAAPAVAPAPDETTASVPPPAAPAPARFEPPPLPPWPAEAAVETPADTGITPVATPAEPPEAVPLPHKRPRLAIAARHIPLPRPRPEAEADGPTSEQAAFERQVDRMR